MAALVCGERRSRDSTFWVLIAGIGLAIGLSLGDFGRWMGWFSYENPTLSHLHVPLVLFAIGATIVDRHFKAIGAVERSNIELEQRVLEKT